MDAVTIALLLYFFVWVVAGLISGLRRGRSSEERIVFTPISLVIRVAKGLKFLDRMQGNRVAKVLGVVGVLLLAYSAYEYYNITMSFLVTRITHIGENIPAPFAPILPGLTISVETFLLLLPGLSIAVIIHELAHALVAKAENLPVKSAGFVVFLAFIFGAFVEIDEESLKKANIRSKLSVYSAGVAANLLTALLLLHIVIIPLMSTDTGLLIVDVAPNSTAIKAGLKKFDVIIEVNNTKTRSFSDLSRILEEGSKNAKQTYIFTIIRDNKIINITIERTGKRKIGILIGPIPLTMVKFLGAATSYYLYQILFYTFMINYVLAIINAAPIFITDGARVLDTIFEKLLREKGVLVSKTIQIITLILLIANMNISGIIH